MDEKHGTKTNQQKNTWTHQYSVEIVDRNNNMLHHFSRDVIIFFKFSSTKTYRWLELRSPAATVLPLVWLEINTTNLGGRVSLQIPFLLCFFFELFRTAGKLFAEHIFQKTKIRWTKKIWWTNQIASNNICCPGPKSCVGIRTTVGLATTTPPWYRK